MIRYFEGHIPDRGSGIALKFRFDRQTVEDIKGAINRQRTSFSTRTGQPTCNAGGWVPSEKCWYIAREIWPAVLDELEQKGYHFQQEHNGAEFFENAEYADYVEREERQHQERTQYQAPPPKPRPQQIESLAGLALLGLPPDATKTE